MTRAYLERKIKEYEASHAEFASPRAELDESRTNTILSSP